MLIPYESRKYFLPPFKERKGGIYFMYCGFEVVYIGTTWNFYARLALHSYHEKFLANKVDTIKIVILPYEWEDRNKIYAAELALIKKYQPRLNQMSTKKYRRPDAERKA